MKNPCPQCLKSTRAVKPVTLESLLTSATRESLTSFEGFRFCPSTTCSVVYWHPERGTCLKADSLQVAVFQKSKEPSRLVCYCFEHSVEAISKEVSRTGTSEVVGSITEKCRNHQDRCPETNPQGSCCLGNVRAVVRLAQEASQSPIVAEPIAAPPCCGSGCAVEVEKESYNE